MIENVVIALALFVCVLVTVVCFVTADDKERPYDWESQGL